MHCCHQGIWMDYGPDIERGDDDKTSTTKAMRQRDLRRDLAEHTEQRRGIGAEEESRVPRRHQDVMQ